MDNYVKIFPGIGGIQPTPTNKIEQNSSRSRDFEDILNQKIKDRQLKISQHAQARMLSRNIQLSDKQITMLIDAENKAEQKGEKESLILMDNIAFVVSVKNRTVITAVDGSSMKQNVFTNIDGAVIV